MLVPGLLPNHIPNGPGLPLGNATPNSKKQREVYVGNLPPHLASEPVLRELFNQLMSACEGFDARRGPAVHNVQLCGGGTYAFIEFRDEQLCETAMLFTGMFVAGRNLRINHPNGYLAHLPHPPCLIPPPALLAKFALSPDHVAAVATGATVGPGAPAGGTGGRIDEKRQRELYVGNLAVGVVTAPMLRELFTAPLLTLEPAGGASAAPPVVDTRLDAGGKFAFIEFRDASLASTALTLFHGMEFCGRPMTVARPSGYVPPPSASQPSAPLLSTSSATHTAPTSSTAAVGTAASDMAKASSCNGSSARPPTAHLRLDNLLTESILADDAEFRECYEDIREECARFGKLARYVIPRKGHDLCGHDEADSGRVFVSYESVDEAERARAALDGREFDGQRVRASFVNEASDGLQQKE